ncbi:hypothetical protein SLS62_004669 [Diatrype stigma]|uniref:Uncharacterized protein n=1 Tax=Diatrype stigma TaxID=117547 RepID=A0AAN9YT68_9PEZI
MKLPTILLAVFTCAWALSGPHSHGAVVEKNDDTPKLHRHLRSAQDVQLKGEDVKKGVQGLKDKKDVLAADVSIAKPIVGDEKGLDTALSTSDATDLPTLTSRTDVANIPEAGLFAESIKQLLYDTLDEYNEAHPLNRIPDWLFCYDPNAIAMTGTRHDREHIWETLVEANRLRQTPYLDRPRFQGTHYPHVATFTDLNSQSESRLRRIDVGHHTGNINLYPIVMGGVVFRDGYFPFTDRILFDDDGVFLGAMTFRGSHWYWCIPCRYRDNVDPGHPDRGASASGVPGADESMMRFEFPARPWLAAGNEIGGGSHAPPP